MQYRHYEMAYILRTDVGEDVVTKLRERFDAIVEAHEGKVVKFDNWGKRKLAYEIDKNPKGVYHYLQFFADANCVAELQRNLKIHDAVLKYMAVLLNPDVDPEKLLAATAEGADQRPPADEEEDATPRRKPAARRAESDDESESKSDDESSEGDSDDESEGDESEGDDESR